MAGRLQKAALTAVAASAISFTAAASDPIGPFSAAALAERVHSGWAPASGTRLPLGFGFSAGVAPALGGEGGEASLHYALSSRIGFFASTALKRRRDETGTPERYATAGATLRNLNGWTAKLFVAWFRPGHGIEDDLLELRPSSTVNAQFSRLVARRTRLTVDLFNLFDTRRGDTPFADARAWRQPGAIDSYFFHPAQGRGARVRLRIAF